MSARRVFMIGCLLLVTSVCACGTNEVPTPSSQALISLPTHSGAPGCRDVGVDAVLAGAPGDPRVAWLETLPPRGAATRVDIAWPPGSRARFAPGLEVVNATGQVVMRAGDRVTSACVGVNGILNIVF